jgi:hypothetical protein
MNIRKLFTSFIAFFIISVYLTQVLPARTVLVKHSTLAQKTMSLNKRYGNTYVNDVFKDNILLSLAYMDGRVHNKSDINWSEIEKPSVYKIELHQGEVFAFHEYILPEYKDKRIMTTNAHFSSYEGFLSDGYLVGDGVCHLASLIKWAAKDAGLSVLAPTNHDFAYIPEIPKEDGVSIYTMPDQPSASSQQNLYIENTFDKPVIFAFDYTNGNLSLTISKSN